MEAEMALFARIVVNMLFDCWNTAHIPIALLAVWYVIFFAYSKNEQNIANG